MRVLIAFVLAWLLSGPAVAQQAEVTIPIPVLIIDTQRVFLELSLIHI